MKKIGMVFGAAAVAVVAGCKDPDYRRTGEPAQNEVRYAAPVEPAPAPRRAVEIQAVEPARARCLCPPGTKHETPCACGAADCLCVVTPKAVRVAPPVEPETTAYVVQNGDYLAKLSKRFNVTIASLKKVNGLKGDMIRVGQTLKIPGKVDVGEQKAPVVRKAGPAKAAKAEPYAGATKEYVVKGGDTLGAIAYGHGINVRQLKALNGLSGDVVRAGQKLKVPAEKVAKKAAPAAAPKAAKAEKKASAKATVAVAVAPAPAAAAPAAATAEPPKAAPAPEAAAPAAAPAPAPAPEAAAATVPYVVQEGEDITAIVVKFGVSASEIRELNNLGEGDTLKAGQTIKLPAEEPQQ